MFVWQKAKRIHQTTVLIGRYPMTRLTSLAPVWGFGRWVALVVGR